MSTYSFAANSEDFFSAIEVDVTQEDVVSDKFRVSGNIGSRFHFAPQSQLQQYPFTRQSPAVASARFDGFLQWDYRYNKNINLRASVDVSYDFANNKNYENDIIDETTILFGQGNGWSLKFGRQLWVVGEANYHRLLDVINPTDNRDLGLAELDELRLPVLASKIAYQQSRWGADIILPQEFRRNIADTSNGDFDPFITLGGANSLEYANNPEVSLLDPDWGARLFVSYPWGDVSVVAAQHHASNATLIADRGTHFEAAYPQLTTSGLSANYIVGSWLLKSEFAYQRGNYFHSVINSNNVFVKKSTQEYLLGAGYSGFTDVDINLELYQRNIVAYDTTLTESNRDYASSLDVKYYLYNDKLNINLFWNRWWQSNDDLLRLKLSYDYTDDISLAIGYIDYRAKYEDSILSPYEKNDRLFMSLIYDF
jgi:hypothetical protein